MRAIAAALIGVAALAACAEEKTVWVKPGASDEEFTQAIEICTEEAQVVVAGRGVNRVTRTDQDTYSRCLTEFGFRRVRRRE